MTTRVVHLRRAPFDVRIDRRTEWGNPFIVGRDGARAEVIRKYHEWITAPAQRELLAKARRILPGKVLGCWCSPQACHGDVLADLVAQ